MSYVFQILNVNSDIMLTSQMRDLLLNPIDHGHQVSSDDTHLIFCM